METFEATLIERDEKRFIKIQTDEEVLEIPISEDKPNEVKKAFNRLIARLRKGEFQIGFKEVGPDLFSQVANEYIHHLNREIREVRKEMENFKLVDT